MRQGAIVEAEAVFLVTDFFVDTGGRLVVGANHELDFWNAELAELVLAVTERQIEFMPGCYNGTEIGETILEREEGARVVVIGKRGASHEFARVI